MDQQLPGTLGMLITCVFQIAGALAAILSATPIFAVAVFPISWVYLGAMNYFRNVTRELKRLDAISRSPIYSHFSETLGGLSVIRAFGREAGFARANEAKVGMAFGLVDSSLTFLYFRHPTGTSSSMANPSTSLKSSQAPKLS